MSKYGLLSDVDWHQKLSKAEAYEFYTNSCAMILNIVAVNDEPLGDFVVTCNDMMSILLL